MDIIITITETQNKVLKHGIADVQERMQSIIDSMSMAMEKEMVIEAIDVFVKDKKVNSIPATNSEIIDKFSKRTDYKDQATKNEDQRKAEEKPVEG